MKVLYSSLNLWEVHEWTYSFLGALWSFFFFGFIFLEPSSGPLFCFFALKVISNQISLLIHLTVSWCLQQKLIPSEIGLSLQSYFQWIIQVTNFCDFWYISDCADFVKGDKDKHLRVKVCLSGYLLRSSCGEGIKLSTVWLYLILLLIAFLVFH